ncbi:ROK family protein [Kitasatospora sp. NPDC056138]|uniref:ROK family protein n=1 Tax=Kitasatospora sp. NPDC056138 TaxID=3345724 RepID=UPI0035DC76DF
MASADPLVCYAGVDIGGTSLRAALVGDDGQVLGRLYDRPREPEIRSQLEEVRERLTSEADRVGVVPVAAGMAVAGSVDKDTGRITSAPTAAEILGTVPSDLDLGIRVLTVANDANAALVGEWRHGAASGTRDNLGFFIGTGLGGGAVVNGSLLTGSTGLAGEFGHIAIGAEGRACPCGGQDCLEQYVSGTALARGYRERIRAPAEISAVEVATAADRGDRAATDAFDELGTRLGVAVAGLVNVFNPEVVVIGGGLSAVHGLFMPAAVRGMERHMMPMAARRVRVELALLGRAAGVVGASVLAQGMVGSEKLVQGR